MVGELNVLTEWIPEQMGPGTVFVLENAGEVGEKEDPYWAVLASPDCCPSSAAPSIAPPNSSSTTARSFRASPANRFFHHRGHKEHRGKAIGKAFQPGDAIQIRTGYCVNQSQPHPAGYRPSVRLASHQSEPSLKSGVNPRGFLCALCVLCG
jgi:hypothetical protein